MNAMATINQNQEDLSSLPPPPPPSSVTSAMDAGDTTVSIISSSSPSPSPSSSASSSSKTTTSTSTSSSAPPSTLKTKTTLDDNVPTIISTTTEKWKRFSEWMHCICIVTFDLELGQTMEIVYPPHVQLSEQEKMNICYLAFPDSNSGCMGDTQFHIRLRVAPATATTMLKPEHTNFNNKCIPVQKADAGHYWGFVYFRQIKDNDLPRGYFQKSLVLLTRLPFINLFYELCSLIAPKYFDSGDCVLESVCDSICKWPTLSTGVLLQLPCLGINYQTIIPTMNSKSPQLLTSTVAIAMDTSTTNSSDTDDENNLHNRKNLSPPQLLSSVHEIDIFRSLFSVLSHIYLLWELVLTAEPIVVIGASPTHCSHMVQSLMSLISPLSYCAESRPYFTIHDSEFKEFTQHAQGPPPIILGVTNPFFAKTLQHWPHTIRLVDDGASSISSNNYQQSLNQQNNHHHHPHHHHLHHHQQQQSQSLTSSFNQIIIGNQQKLRRLKNTVSSSKRLLELPPGVYTQYKQFLQNDQSIIKKIKLGVKMSRPMSVQSALLRRHMLELTQSFMIPLERYMASLMPLQRNISAFKAAPTPNQFKQDDFLATLEASGPQLTSTLRGDWVGLYKRFFRSPNFKGWYENRYTELQQTLQTLQLQALSEVNLKQWVQGKHEVEIVDMILKLKQKLKLCNNGDEEDNKPTGLTSSASASSLSTTMLRSDTKQQLHRHLEDMKQLLPEDLKMILNNTNTTT